MIVALVCIGVASVLMFSLLRLAAAHREVVLAETRQVQAHWLAQSGLERALSRLAADPKYRGETWALTAADLGGEEGAVVRIEILSPAEYPDRQVIRVQADYPDHPQWRVREVREVAVPHPKVLKS